MNSFNYCNLGGIKDEDLELILDMLQMKGFVDRESGWNAINDWKDVLSGGDKQRVRRDQYFSSNDFYISYMMIILWFVL
jgi:hypothetical protein